MQTDNGKPETFGVKMADVVEDALGPLEAHMLLWGANANEPGASKDELNAWIVTRALVDRARDTLAKAVAS